MGAVNVAAVTPRLTGADANPPTAASPVPHKSVPLSMKLFRYRPVAYCRPSLPTRYMPSWVPDRSKQAIRAWSEFTCAADSTLPVARSMNRTPVVPWSSTRETCMYPDADNELLGTYEPPLTCIPTFPKEPLLENVTVP